MPTYVYRRPDGTTFDVFQKISDAPLTTDPETGDPVTRVISGGAGLQFKGNGFYLTDYVRKDGGTNESGEPTPSPSQPSEAKAKPKATASESSTASATKADG